MRIGILGGSFNPVHFGHLRAAIEVRERLGLDRVELVPAKEQPHKYQGDMLPFHSRVALIKLALKGVPGLAVNPLEGERQGPSYTCDTLAEYRARLPEAERFFILSALTLFNLPSWRHGLELPELVDLVVVPRGRAGRVETAEFLASQWPLARPADPGPADLAWSFVSGGRILYLSTPRIEISSTIVRDRWRRGRCLTGLVPPAVERVLEKGGPDFDAGWGVRFVHREEPAADLRV
jgi:nicotinate-nucleotide adenylyltransferase